MGFVAAGCASPTAPPQTVTIQATPTVLTTTVAPVPVVTAAPPTPAANMRTVAVTSAAAVPLTTEQVAPRSVGSHA